MKNIYITVAGVTVMLSLTVFMNIVSELMPITSDAVPLIGNLKRLYDARLPSAQLKRKMLKTNFYI